MFKYVQMIIPMAALTQLGYEVKWTGSGCTISSPDGAQLPVQLDQGCPTLPRQERLGILQQVEDQKRRETMRNPYEVGSHQTKCGTATSLPRSGICEEVDGSFH